MTNCEGKKKKKTVDDKVFFLFKRKTTLVVDDKRGRFFIDNSLSPLSVSRSSISEVYFGATHVQCHSWTPFSARCTVTCAL